MLSPLGQCLSDYKMIIDYQTDLKITSGSHLDFEKLWACMLSERPGNTPDVRLFSSHAERDCLLYIPSTYRCLVGQRCMNRVFNKTRVRSRLTTRHEHGVYWKFI